MSANTETTGADRTKCAEWCGKEYGARGVPFRRSCGFPMYFEHGAAFNVAVKDNEPAWCSIACRDARLPPIAAPAAHIERRKGQVWSYQYKDNDPLRVTLDVRREPNAWATVEYGMVFDRSWTDEAVTMTLLADATPEPLTAKDVFGEIPPGSKLTNDTPVKLASAPPAQEAPKAAPMLEWSFTDKEGRDHWFATGGERDTASRAYGAWMKAQTGKPYSGPERSPRPQLAADWVEDCLEDA